MQRQIYTTYFVHFVTHADSTSGRALVSMLWRGIFTWEVFFLPVLCYDMAKPNRKEETQ